MLLVRKCGDLVRICAPANGRYQVVSQKAFAHPALNRHIKWAVTAHLITVRILPKRVESFELTTAWPPAASPTGATPTTAPAAVLSQQRFISLQVHSLRLVFLARLPFPG